MTTITCTCDICTAQAEKVGKDILGAVLNEKLAAAAKSAKGRHSLVYDANNQSPISAAVRNATGMRAL